MLDADTVTSGSPVSIRQRFNKKWTPEPFSGCHLWTAVCSGRGYGTFSIKHKSVSAHRTSWELNRGQVPVGLWVLHKCDTPSCVNPDHLFLGTGSDNALDALQKGRRVPRVGTEHHYSKFRNEDIVAIRQSSEKRTALAAKYRVFVGTIDKIRARQIWKHVV